MSRMVPQDEVTTLSPSQPNRTLASRLLIASVMTLLAGSWATAQVPGKYFPLDHRQLPGVASRWQAIGNPGAHAQPQPVKVILPEPGSVTFYQGGAHQAVATQSPAQVTMLVGHTYRLKISALKFHPGVELYPTVEIIDGSHLSIRFTVMPPVIDQGGGTYDPSPSGTDGLWDVGSY